MNSNSLLEVISPNHWDPIIKGSSTREMALARALAIGDPNPKKERWKGNSPSHYSADFFINQKPSPIDIDQNASFSELKNADIINFEAEHIQCSNSAIEITQAIDSSPWKERFERLIRSSKDPFHLMSLAYAQDITAINLTEDVTKNLSISWTPPVALMNRHLVFYIASREKITLEFDLSTLKASPNHLGLSFFLAPEAQAEVQIVDLAPLDAESLSMTSFSELPIRSQLSTKQLSGHRSESRLANQVSLVGEDAIWNFSSAGLKNSKSKLHQLTEVHHLVGKTYSQQLLKSFAADSSEVSFWGRVTIHPDAQKSNADQLSRGLIVGEKAQVRAYPELEIHADDVKATHGATVAELDEDQRLYLMSRGLSFKQSQDILMRSFFGELTDGYSKDVQSRFAQLVSNVLEEGL